MYMCSRAEVTFVVSFSVRQIHELPHDGSLGDQLSFVQEDKRVCLFLHFVFLDGNKVVVVVDLDFPATTFTSFDFFDHTPAPESVPEEKENE